MKQPFAMQRVAKPEAKAEPKPKAAPEEKPEEDPGVKSHIRKVGDKFKATIDDGDELGPQETEHEDLESAKAAHAEALEKKYGMEKVEDAEEKVAPGVHDKVGSYLSHMSKE